MDGQCVEEMISEHKFSHVGWDLCKEGLFSLVGRCSQGVVRPFLGIPRSEPQI